MSQARSSIPDSHTDILHKKGLAHVATIGPDGAPQTSPVWFDFDGECVLFSLTTTRQKYRNLKSRPDVALSFVDPDNPYRYLEIRGLVESMDDDVEYAFINAMSKKYIDRDVYPFARLREHRIVVKVRPRRVAILG